MSFNLTAFQSYSYLFFLPAAFLIYWLLESRSRKIFLIAASYVFYCSWHDDRNVWHWEFGFVLLGVTLFNWAYGRFILARPQGGRLWPGIVVNIGALAYFKYLLFLVENAAAAAHVVGISWQPPVLHIILPLGISFFTFQGVAYLVDVASGEPPLASLTDFMLFKSFWPQLIAGPIIRLDEMREQIAVPRRLDYANLAEGRCSGSSLVSQRKYLRTTSG